MEASRRRSDRLAPATSSDVGDDSNDGNDAMALSDASRQLSSTAQGRPRPSLIRRCKTFPPRIHHITQTSLAPPEIDYISRGEDDAAAHQSRKGSDAVRFAPPAVGPSPTRSGGDRIALNGNIEDNLPVEPKVHLPIALAPKANLTAPYHQATAMASSVLPPPSRGLAADVALFTRADLKRVEDGEQVNDSCIDTYIAALVLPSLQRPEATIEYWSRCTMSSFAPGRHHVQPSFNNATPDSVTIPVVFHTGRKSSALKAPTVDITKGPPLQWATSMAFHENHWTLILVRFPPDPRATRAEVLVCDSIEHHMGWHKSSLMQLAGRIAEALGRRMATASRHHADHAGRSQGRNKGKGKGIATEANHSTINIDINCQMAQVCPRQRDGTSCGPVACLLLARFYNNPAAVWDRLLGKDAPIAITDDQARDHMKVHLAQHLNQLECTTRLNEMKEQAFLSDINAESRRDPTPLAQTEDDPVPQDAPSLLKVIKRKRREDDRATFLERERVDFVTRRRRLHETMI